MASFTVVDPTSMPICSGTGSTAAPSAAVTAGPSAPSPPANPWPAASFRASTRPARSSLVSMGSFAMTLSFIGSFTESASSACASRRYSLIDSPGLMKNSRMAINAISSELSCMPVSIHRSITPRYAEAKNAT